MSVKKELGLCHYCPSLCRAACPVADADRDESSTPQAKMATMRLLAEKKIKWSQETALAAYKCSHCGNSTEACELDNPVAAVLDVFRAKAFNKEVAPDAVYKYCRRFKKRNNPYNVDLFECLQNKLPAEHFKPAEVTYFPGCVEIQRGFTTIRKTLELIDKLGVDRVGLFDEQIQCCGYPLVAAGDIRGFREHAEVMMHMMEGYPLLVSAAPACLFTFRHLYPAHGYHLSTEFLTMTQFLETCLQERSFHVKRDVKESVAYHDPCYQGRYLEDYESPRRLIKAVSGESPVEFRRCRSNSYCSGGGGLLPVARPETAARMTANRLDEFKETGADVLISTCPTCVHRFKKQSQGATVKNIVEYLNNVVEPEKPKGQR